MPLGRELLLFQGIQLPKARLEGFSETFLGDLAGNAPLGQATWQLFLDSDRFSSTIIAAIMLSLVTALSEPTESELEEEKTIDSMLAHLGGFAASQSRVNGV